MFGALKKKLSKAIKSISEKLEKKEEKIEEIEKKIEKVVEEKIEEIEEIIEEPIEEIEEKIEKKVEEVVEEIKKPKEPETEIEVGVEELEVEFKEEIKEKVKEEVKKEIKKAAKEIEEIKEKPKKKSFIKKIFERATKKIVEKRLTERDLLPVLSELETDLIEADVAVEVAEKIKRDLLNQLTDKEIKRGNEEEMIVDAFKNSLKGILSVPEIDLKKLSAEKKPIVLVFLGFNGSGKTTSVAKVANWLKEEGYTCVLAAADTFRAASLEQLEEHADRIGVKMIKHKYGADPAAVVYDAVEHAKAKGVHFVLADTAGRIHTNQDLMKEMEKIVRVNNPDLKVLVIDSLTGNDAVLQARAFGELGVDATIFTKIDVNEKGGAILSVTNELKKPILFLGIGQEYKDFEKFDADKFVNRVLE